MKEIVTFRLKTIAYTLEVQTNLTNISLTWIQLMQMNLEAGLLALCNNEVYANLVDRTITCCCYAGQNVVEHRFGLSREEQEAAYYNNKWLNHDEVVVFLTKVEDMLHKNYGVSFTGGYYNLAIVCALVSLKISNKGLEIQRMLAGQFYLGNNEKVLKEMEETTEDVKVNNTLPYVACVAGLVIFTLFAIINYIEFIVVEVK